jgi:hypothetical protein
MSKWKLVRVAPADKGNQKRRRRLRMSLAIMVGILAISGFVLGDVVFTYRASTSVGANVVTPFYFQDGADYATANARAFITIVCGGSLPAVTTTCGGTATPAGQSTETITIFGPNGANAYVTAASSFAVSAGFPPAGDTFSISYAVGTVVTAWTEVTCAYVFISTQVPTIPMTLSADAPSGQAAGCNAYEPTYGGGYLEDLNLFTGAAADPAGCAGQAGVTYVGPGAAPCSATFINGQAAYAAATVLLYLTFIIGVSGAAPTGSTTILITPIVI